MVNSAHGCNDLNVEIGVAVKLSHELYLSRCLCFTSGIIVLTVCVCSFSVVAETISKWAPGGGLKAEELSALQNLGFFGLKMAYFQLFWSLIRQNIRPKWVLKSEGP